MFRQHSFNTKISNLIPPLILVSPQALADMWDITDLHKDEVGWLGTARNLGRNQFLIEEIFLVEQGAHGSTTEIEPDGIAKLVADLYQQRGDAATEVINRIRFWGHSHVNMGLTPSGQDDSQLRKLLTDVDDFFIAARTNKSRNVRFDLAWKSGLMAEDVPWEMQADVNSRRAYWEAELKEKVRDIYGDLDKFTPYYQRDSKPARIFQDFREYDQAQGRYQAPFNVDIATNTYIDGYGVNRSLHDIDDEELELAGFELFTQAEIESFGIDIERIDRISNGFGDYWLRVSDIEGWEDDDSGPSTVDKNAKQQQVIFAGREKPRARRSRRKNGGKDN